jgi:hypothetical protein
MKFHLAASALLAATLLIAGNGALAGAASDNDASAPINLTAVKIDASIGQDELFALPGLVTVSFTNVQEKTIDEVVFGLRDAYGHLTEQYHDVGPFAANVVLRNHRFTDTQIGAGQTLVVDVVKFHDGSTWYPASLRALRQTTAAAFAERASL